MSCRIQSLAPPCDYNVEGIEQILLLDFEDFYGFKFDSDDLYDGALVTSVMYAGTFVPVATPESAKYTSSTSGGIYTHTIETFVPNLDAGTIANLHLATKRKHLVCFQTKEGRFFTFGYEAGATVSYAGQTAEATGNLITASTNSIYPLFEVSAATVTGAQQYTAEFVPDFTNFTFCVNA